MRNTKLASTLLIAALLTSTCCFAVVDSDTQITYDELKTLSDIQLKLHPNVPALVDNVVAKYGRRPTYTAKQIDALSWVAQLREAEVQVEPTPLIHLKPRPRQGLDVIAYAILHPKLRQDYTDVLPGEDPSQQNLAAGKFDDLNGASLSYTWDGKAHSDTWSAEAALVVPMVWNGNLAYGPMPIFYGLVPSVSLNRVDTSGDPANATDSLIYRAGAFAQWLLVGGPGEKLHARLNARGSFTYATDTQNELRLPAGEFDIEPQIFYGPNWALGYLFNPFVGEQTAIDPNLAHFQVRTWLHGEYGSVDHSSEQVTLHSTFFRIGPILQLKVDVPKLPAINKQLTLNVEYHYVPTLSGPTGHDSLLKTSAEFTLLDSQGGPRVTLKGSYTNGGLDLTKQNVETFTMGLGVLF